MRRFRLSPLVLALMLAQACPPGRAGTMRPDIDMSVYRDFAENRGRFAAGARNVSVFRKDGTLSGVIDFMPDFGAAVDGGFSTLVAPNVTVTATHVGYDDYISFGKRFYQRDATLFTGAENVNNYALLGETSVRAQRVHLFDDFSITRFRTLVTDAAPAELFNDEARLVPGLRLARVGGGSHAVATGVNQTEGSGYGWLAGGFADVQGSSTRNNPSGQRVITLRGGLFETPTTPLDISTQGGDSGSGVWGWDAVDQRWKFVGMNSAGGGPRGFNKVFYPKSANTWVEATLLSFNQDPIQTISPDALVNLAVQDEATGAGHLVLDGVQIAFQGLRRATADRPLSEADFAATRNLIFGGAGGELRIDAPAVDLGAGSIRFDADFRITGAGRLNSAGYIVSENITVNSHISGRTGDTWRKLGKGTLVIGGVSDNAAELNIGEGRVELDRQGGRAARHIRLGSGRGTVRLLRAGQLEGAGLGFGVRGGTLELYGNDLVWNDILHMDSGARIANGREGSSASFRFSGTGEKTFLGHFSDGAANAPLHVVYAPGTDASIWRLRGGAALTGGLEVTRGQLWLQAPQVLHASSSEFAFPGDRSDGSWPVSKHVPTEYESARFSLGSVNVADGARLIVERHTTADGEFIVQDGGLLQLQAGGALADAGQGRVEGARLGGSVRLQGKRSLLSADVHAGFTVYSTASVDGIGALQKLGSGTWRLEGPLRLQGQGLANLGLLSVGAADAVNASMNWQIASAGVLELRDHTGHLPSFVPRLDAAASGTLALSGNLPALFSGMPAALSLGSADTLTIGVAGQSLQAPTVELWLGGGGGTVLVAGDLPASVRHLFIGNGNNDGIVRLLGDGRDFSGLITVRDGVTLDADARAMGAGLADVSYGAIMRTASAQIIHPAARGVFVAAADSDHADMSRFASLGLGVSKGSTRTLNSWLPGTGAYRFGGGGTLVMQGALTGNQGLVVDGQGHGSGMLVLGGENTFSGDITVQGHETAGQPSGSVTLRLGNDRALDERNALTLRNGGILDLDGRTVSVRIAQADATTRIVSPRQSTLNVMAETDTSISSRITGLLALRKLGAANLVLTSANDFSGTVNIRSGTLTVGNAAALGRAEVVVSRDGMLDLAGYNITNGLTLTGSDTVQLTSSRRTEQRLPILALLGDTRASSIGADLPAVILDYRINGHTLTFSGSRIDLSSASVNAGNMQFLGTEVFLSGRIAEHTLGSAGDLIFGPGSTLHTRDLNQSSAGRKRVVLDGGRLGNGVAERAYFRWGNGGGAQSVLQSPVEVRSDSVLEGNNRGFNLSLVLAGRLSGTGGLTIASGGPGIVLRGDISDYRGRFTLGDASQLAFEIGSSQVFAGSMAGGSPRATLRKRGAGALQWNGSAREYRGNTAIEAGEWIINSPEGLSNGPYAVQDGNLVLQSASAFEGANAISGSGGLIKRGAGSARLTGALSFTGRTEVQDGLLEIGNSNSGTTRIAAQGRLLSTGRLAGSVSNAGVLTMRQGAAGQTLHIAGNYVGDNGSVLLGTVLGGDDSLTDRLIVGGDSSGTSSVQVENLGGAGAQTVRGIEIIRIAGKSDAVFTQQGRVVAGPYEYTLRKTGKDWFLSSYAPPVVVDPPVAPPVVPPIVPPVDVAPVVPPVVPPVAPPVVVAPVVPPVVPPVAPPVVVAPVAPPVVPPVAPPVDVAPVAPPVVPPVAPPVDVVPVAPPVAPPVVTVPVEPPVAGPQAPALPDQTVPDVEVAVDNPVRQLRPEIGGYLSSTRAAFTLFRPDVPMPANTLSPMRGASLGEMVQRFSLSRPGTQDASAPVLQHVTVGNGRYRMGDGQIEVSTRQTSLQLAGDVWRRGPWRAGLIAGYGKADGRSTSRLTGYYAKHEMSGFQLGAYGAWAGESGLQFSLAAQSNRAAGSIHGIGLERQRYRMSGWGTTATAAYRLPLLAHEAWSLTMQPYAQLSPGRSAVHGRGLDSLVRNGANTLQQRQLGVALQLVGDVAASTLTLSRQSGRILSAEPGLEQDLRSWGLSFGAEARLSRALSVHAGVQWSQGGEAYRQYSYTGGFGYRF